MQAREEPDTTRPAPSPAPAKQRCDTRPSGRHLLIQGTPSGTEVQHWHPFSEMFPSNARVGQLFENMWHAAAHEGYAPGGELEETDDGFVLELDLPGVAEEDVTIDVTGRRVAVRGKRAEKERTGLMRHSTRVTGSFACEVSLPAEVDEKGATAKLTDGVLTVRLS